MEKIVMNLFFVGVLAIACSAQPEKNTPPANVVTETSTSSSAAKTTESNTTVPLEKTNIFIYKHRHHKNYKKRILN